MTFSLLHGVTLGPLIGLVIDVHPGILVSAFMATAIVFACFSGVAMLARRRVFIYLGVVDTQEIIERAHLGDLDYVTDALLLSVNFISVFVRILIIILKAIEEDEKKKNKERKD
ncbi:unnamed protein product [Lactuca virosa]|uniref:Uncharacterized protein n=1 Tax=Lactuca virosa TaxID=75947 RepID=A0AAU9PBY9_9ASTR|nr:unnamed protein product [Lactuca virosa]